MLVVNALRKNLLPGYGTTALILMISFHVISTGYVCYVHVFVIVNKVIARFVLYRMIISVII